MKTNYFLLTAIALTTGVGQVIAKEQHNPSMCSWMSTDVKEDVAKEQRNPLVCSWMPTDVKGDPLKSFFMLGANYTRVNFAPKGLSSFNGNMGGLEAEYAWQPPNAFYAGLELDWRQGSMTGSSGKRDLVQVNTAEKLGYTWVGKCWLYNLYTGFGFNYLGHHLHPSTTSPSAFSGSYFPPFISTATSIKFNYYEFYFPLGFTSSYEAVRWFTIGLNFEWMAQVFTSVGISSLPGAYWNLQQKLLNFLVEVPFIFHLTCRSNWKFVINPFYEHWQDGKSTATTSSGTPLGLPLNNYNFYGVEFNFIYNF